MSKPTGQSRNPKFGFLSARGKLGDHTLRPLPAIVATVALPARPGAARCHVARLLPTPRRHLRPGPQRAVPAPRWLVRLGVACCPHPCREHRRTAACHQSHCGPFGQPVAFMRDLGTAMPKAVAACYESPIRDLACHIHFLAAVCRQLMDADHAVQRLLRLSRGDNENFPVRAVSKGSPAHFAEGAADHGGGAVPRTGGVARAGRLARHALPERLVSGGHPAPAAQGLLVAGVQRPEYSPTASSRPTAWSQSLPNSPRPESKNLTQDYPFPSKECDAQQRVPGEPLPRSLLGGTLRCHDQLVEQVLAYHRGQEPLPSGRWGRKKRRKRRNLALRLRA